MPQESRKNNFNLVRLIGALLVMIGHMGPIMGADTPVMGQDLHGIGVEILFLIGGFLISESWLHDPNPLRYGIRRFLRLWPPYAVMILLMTFVTGPLLSELGVSGYFGSWWSEFLKNLRFYIVYAQPGVFTNHPMPLVTNGSLWTMPVEPVLYILTPLVCLLFGIRKKSRRSLWMYAAFVVLLIIVGTWLSGQSEVMWVFYGTSWASALRLGIFFFIGIFCAMEPVRKLFKMQWTPIAFLAIVLVLYEIRPVQYIVMILALPYLVFSLALAPNPLFYKVGRKHDLSYGIYLYGFFFQQLVTQWQRQSGISLGVPASIAISLCLTVPVAFLSNVLVEKKAQQLCQYLITKLKSRNAETEVRNGT